MPLFQLGPDFLPFRFLGEVQIFLFSMTRFELSELLLEGRLLAMSLTTALIEFLPGFFTFCPFSLHPVLDFQPGILDLPELLLEHCPSSLGFTAPTLQFPGSCFP